MSRLVFFLLCLPGMAFAHSTVKITKQLSKTVSQEMVCGEAQKIANELERLNLGPVSYFCRNWETGEGFFDGWHRQFASGVIQFDERKLCPNGMPVLAEVNLVDVDVDYAKTIELEDKTLIQLAGCPLSHQGSHSARSVFGPNIIREQGDSYVVQGDPRQNSYDQGLEYILRSSFNLKDSRYNFTELDSPDSSGRLYSFPSPNKSKTLYVLVEPENSLLLDFAIDIDSGKLTFHNDSFMIAVNDVKLPTSLLAPLGQTVRDKDCVDRSSQVTYRLNPEGYLIITEGLQLGLDLYGTEQLLKRELYRGRRWQVPSLAPRSVCVNTVDPESSIKSGLDKLVGGSLIGIQNNQNKTWKEEISYREVLNSFYQLRRSTGPLFHRLSQKEELVPRIIDILKDLTAGLINRPFGHEYRDALVVTLDEITRANSLPTHKIKEIIQDEYYQGYGSWRGFIFRRRLARDLSQGQIEKVVTAINDVLKEYKGEKQ